MARWAAFLGLLGLLAATGVIVGSGWEQMTAALAQAGWVAIVAVALFHCIVLATSSAGWRVLIADKPCPSYPLFVYFMWVRAAVNNLMPVARIGGEIAAVRIMTAHGMKRNTAIAATVVELTLSITAIFLFVLGGVILFALRVNDHNTVRQLIWGLALSLPLIAGLVVVQKIGFFGLLMRLFRALFSDKLAAMVEGKAGSVAEIDNEVASFYRHRMRIAGCFFLQFAAWALGSVEIWLALRFLGHPLPPLECVMIEALIQGSASAAFAIPGALGVQEAGFLLFGGMLGLPPADAAALAVIRRGRDLLCYAPGLIAWQMHEGKRLLRS